MIHTGAIASAFDELAESYDEDGRHEQVARQLVGAVGAIHGRVVDVACGTGAVARAITGQHATILAVDVSRAMIARGRSLSTNPAIIWCVGSALPLPVADGDVDVILCASSLHFLGLAALADWRRALRPGGRVGYTLPLRSGFNPSRRFATLQAVDLPFPSTSDDAYALAANAGFTDVSVRTVSGVAVTTARVPAAE